MVMATALSAFRAALRDAERQHRKTAEAVRHLRHLVRRFGGGNPAGKKRKKARKT